MSEPIDFARQTAAIAVRNVQQLEQLEADLIAAWQLFMPGSTSYPARPHLEPLLYYIRRCAETHK
jgi:hypothetical protein